MKTYQLAATVLASAALALGCGGEKKAAEAAGKPVITAPVALSDLEEHIEATGELAGQGRGGDRRRGPRPGDPGGGRRGRAGRPPARSCSRSTRRSASSSCRARARASPRPPPPCGTPSASYKRMKTLREQDVAAAAKHGPGGDAGLPRALARGRRRRPSSASRSARSGTPACGRPSRATSRERHVSRGEYVQVGQPLFELVALDPIEVQFHVAERDSARVAQGQEVTLTVEPHPGETFRGQVTLIAPTIDPKTRTLRVEARRRRTPTGACGRGSSRASTSASRCRKGVLMVPEEAVLQRADGEVVFRTAGQPRRARGRVRRASTATAWSRSPRASPRAT